MGRDVNRYIDMKLQQYTFKKYAYMTTGIYDNGYIYINAMKKKWNIYKQENSYFSFEANTKSNRSILLENQVDIY